MGDCGTMTNEPKIGFIDVGARDGTHERINLFRDRIQQVLVEPDPAEAERLQIASNDGKQYSVIPVALGNIDGEIDLHVTVNPYCASALRVNHEYLKQYDIDRHFQLKETSKTPCSRYDTLFCKGALPVPHAIKIDVQGFEYQVLEGFGKHLQDCLALEIETHFYPIYQNQRTIGEMVRFLESYNFSLRSLRNSRCLGPGLRGDYYFEGDLVEVNAFFTKSMSWMKAQPPACRQNFQLACEVLDIDSYPGL